jgi:Putative restriction endonuclease
MSETTAAPADRELFSLHPEDWMTQRDSHDEQLSYLKVALRRALPDMFVGRELAVYWVPGQLQYPYAGPDILIARNRPKQTDPTVFLTYEDGPLTLVAEVVSEGTRAQEEEKRDEIYLAALQVPEYLHVDLQRDHFQLYALEEGRYVPIAPAPQGPVWSRVLDVGFVWQDDHRLVRVVTPDGRVMPTWQEESERRLAAEQRALAEAQQRLEAEQHALEEARQRLQAERRAQDEAVQRLEAEQRAQDEARQRVEAERAAAVLAAELERLRRLMGESG